MNENLSDIKSNEKILFAWSSGKDSAMALYELTKTDNLNVASLLTTITKDYGRISMHGVREELLDMQSESLGIPLDKMYITKDDGNDEYEKKMENILTRHKNNGVSHVAFGDIFLEDLKKYREENLAKIDIKGLFPVWKRKTDELARDFIDLGFKAYITCINSDKLDKSFVGREFDKSFLTDLPSSVDPCGENGEFHSFVYAGPIFKKPIPIKTGEVVLKNERFYFCDLIPD